jgi:hypothetical protein
VPGRGRRGRPPCRGPSRPLRPTPARSRTIGKADAAKAEPTVRDRRVVPPCLPRPAAAFGCVQRRRLRRLFRYGPRCHWHLGVHFVDYPPPASRQRRSAALGLQLGRPPGKASPQVPAGNPGERTVALEPFVRETLRPATTPREPPDVTPRHRPPQPIVTPLPWTRVPSPQPREPSTQPRAPRAQNPGPSTPSPRTGETPYQ